MPAVRGNNRGKIARLCSLLREDILQGKYEPGSPLPSTRQLSKAHGVAEGTVSAAVRHLSHEGLAIRVKGHGSFVAEELPPSQDSLDLVRYRYLAGKENGVHSLRWIEQFTEGAEQHGWAPRWHHVSCDGPEDVAQLATRFSHSTAVIVLFELPPKLPWLLYQRGIPVVAVFLMAGGIGDRPEPYPQISYDREESARLATEHLVSLGHKRIGFVGLRFSPLRAAGFLEVVSRNNLINRSEWIINLDSDVYSPRSASGRLCRELCERVLKSKNRPEAFCCSSLRTAHAVADAAIDMGLKVPEDLAIIACDEAEPDVHGALGITTATISRKEACQKAMELLEQVRQQGLSRKSDLFEPVMMPLHLTIRDSCSAKLRGISGGQKATSNLEQTEEMPMK